MGKLDICCEINSHSINICMTDVEHIVTEPAIVATVNNEVFVGNAALRVSRNQRNVKLVYPIDEGSITNPLSAKQLIVGALEKLLPNKLFIPRLNVYCVVPCGSNQSDKKIIEGVFSSIGVNSLHFIESPLACYMTMCQKNKLSHIITIDIGHSTTDIAAVKNGKILCGCTTSLGGKHISSVIKEYVDKKFDVDLPVDQADALRDNCISLYHNDTRSLSVTANNRSSNRLEMFSVVARELYDEITRVFDDVVMVINGMLNSFDEADLFYFKDNGLFISGSLSNIGGLDDFLYSKVQLPTQISDKFATCSIVGAREMIRKKA